MILTCPACDTRFLVSAQALGADGRVVRCAKCAHEWHANAPENGAPKPTPKPKTPAPSADDAGGLEWGEEVAENDYVAVPDNEPEQGFEDTEEDTTPPPEEDEIVSEPEPAPPMPEFDEAMFERLSAAAAPKASVISAWQHPLWQASAALLLLGCAILLGLVLRDSLQPSLAPVYALAGYYAEDAVTLADVALRELPSRNKKRYEIQCRILNTSDAPRLYPQMGMKILNPHALVLAEDDAFFPATGGVLKPGKSLPCKRLRFENPFSNARLLVIDIGSPFALGRRGAWELSDSKAEEAPHG